MGASAGGDQHHLANGCGFEELDLDVKGATDEELAASLVAEMLRTGLTLRVPDRPPSDGRIEGRGTSRLFQAPRRPPETEIHCFATYRRPISALSLRA